MTAAPCMHPASQGQGWIILRKPTNTLSDGLDFLSWIFKSMSTATATADAIAALYYIHLISIFKTIASLTIKQFTVI